jgi:hypothetical protein
VLNRTNIQVSTGSKLAAAYVRNDGLVGIRVFYHDTNSHISELACDPGGAGNCWVKSNQGVSSDADSSLATVAIGNGGAALFYVLNNSFNVVSQGSNVNGVLSTREYIHLFILDLHINNSLYLYQRRITKQNI